MPLQLGGVETSRPAIVTWDPKVAAEVADAVKQRIALVAQGFKLRDEKEGEAVFDPPPTGPNIHVFRILSQNGDERVVWDRLDPKQVKEAYAKFKELVAKGYTAFATLASGKRGHKITEFDPGLEEVLLASKEVLFVPSTIPG
ncbi:hypothetical protein Rctr197k_113 [Virus Rctr197k]|nr:hypothetical protein Rctr197k_113 [Virus Rctr197k]